MAGSGQNLPRNPRWPETSMLRFAAFRRWFPSRLVAIASPQGGLQSPVGGRSWGGRKSRRKTPQVLGIVMVFGDVWVEISPSSLQLNLHDGYRLEEEEEKNFLG